MKKPELRISIPLQKIRLLDGNYLYGVKATISKHKGYLIIDTGALFSVLDIFVSGYDYQPVNFEDEEVNVSGISSDEIQHVTIRDVGEIKISRYNIIIGYTTILDLSHIKEKFTEKYHVLGLLGHNFFEDNGATIDYLLKKLELINPKYVDYYESF
jgi:hypothetical protein